MLLDAAARSLKVHGFTDILFIGDSGGNQAGLTNVANKLNEEWKDTGVKVFALTDYYNASRIYYRAWLQAAFGYDEDTAGSHAGITDTSQMLFIRPAGVRRDQVKPWGGPKDSGVSGDPAKATADIGKMGVEFKVNAGINQYKLLKNPPQRGGRGRSGAVQSALQVHRVRRSRISIIRRGARSTGPLGRRDTPARRSQSAPQRPTSPRRRQASADPPR
jgi:hypothetical protein